MSLVLTLLLLLLLILCEMSARDWIQHNGEFYFTTHNLSKFKLSHLVGYSSRFNLYLPFLVATHIWVVCSHVHMYVYIFSFFYKILFFLFCFSFLYRRPRKIPKRFNGFGKTATWRYRPPAPRNCLSAHAVGELCRLQGNQRWQWYTANMSYLKSLLSGWVNNKNVTPLNEWWHFYEIYWKRIEI